MSKLNLNPYLNLPQAGSPLSRLPSQQVQLAISCVLTSRLTFLYLAQRASTMTRSNPHHEGNSMSLGWFQCYGPLSALVTTSVFSLHFDHKRSSAQHATSTHSHVNFLIPNLTILNFIPWCIKLI
jgi:hypothetical protein